MNENHNRQVDDMKTFTTRTTSFLALLLFACSSLVSQTRYTEAGATSKFSIGAGVAPGISLPIGDLGEEDDPALGFAFRGAANITYPFSVEMAAFLNAGLDLRSPGVKEDTVLDSRYYSLQYFFVQPGIAYSSLGISLNIGIPMSASEPVPRAPGLDVPDDSTRDVSTEQLNLMLEPRINGTLVLMDEEAYWLGLDISIGIPITTIYKKEFQREKDDVDDGRTLVPGTSAMSAHLGLTMQFGLFDTF